MKYGINTEINSRGKKVIYSYLEDNKTTLHAFFCYIFGNKTKNKKPLNERLAELSKERNC